VRSIGVVLVRKDIFVCVWIELEVELSFEDGFWIFWRRGRGRSSKRRLEKSFGIYVMERCKVHVGKREEAPSGSGPANGRERDWHVGTDSLLFTASCAFL
jgi:hypothetical protein